MPELPDLLYIVTYLKKSVQGRTITGAIVQQPVVIRVVLNQPFEKAVIGKTIEAVGIHGPFLRLDLTDPVAVIINLMLAGRLQHQLPGEEPEGFPCCSFHLDDGSRLNLCDQQKMAKLYVVKKGDNTRVPKYGGQGIDILSDGFTWEAFKRLADRNRRKQVRVFLNDHAVISSIGNAYADEILFDARIHPKTFVGKLVEDQLQNLFSSIRSIMEWGIREVAAAAQPIHTKVREHLKVRNRKGRPCPRCGTTIRREGVRGHDVFFCPSCQPPSRKLFIDWRKATVPPAPGHESAEIN
jgi:formamidopyrimidine-DNA glycosylase